MAAVGASVTEMAVQGGGEGGKQMHTAHSECAPASRL